MLLLQRATCVWSLFARRTYLRRLDKVEGAVGWGRLPPFPSLGTLTLFGTKWGTWTEMNVVLWNGESTTTILICIHSRRGMRGNKTLDLVTTTYTRHTTGTWNDNNWTFPHKSFDGPFTKNVRHLPRNFPGKKMQADCKNAFPLKFFPTSNPMKYFRRHVVIKK